MSSRSKSQKISHNKMPNNAGSPELLKIYEQANRGSRLTEIPIVKVLIKSGQDPQRKPWPQSQNKKMF